jgi:kynurenine formamidase
MLKRPLFSLLAACACVCVQAQTIDLGKGRWLDLSHAYSEDTLYWPTASTFHKETVFEGETEGGFYYTAYDIRTAEHGGTHVDAPIHFYAGRRTVDQLPLESLIGAGVVIDVTAKSSADPDYQLSAADIEAWETDHGPIAGGSIVLVRTGYARYWPDAGQYLGTAERGAGAVPKLHFPGIHPDAAELLVARGIAAVGLDTASVDYGQSTDFMTHRILYEANIPGFENLADLSGLPATGAFIVALPMKIAGGSGAPLRIVAFVGQ